MVPKVGDQIYVDTMLFLHHGEDDFRGGLAEVMVVDEVNETKHWIRIKERPGFKYAWEGFLELEQENLKAEFGQSRAHPEPDYRPGFGQLRMLDDIDSYEVCFPSENTDE